MSMSLRDQLLQAGLITEKQAKEAEKKPHHAQQRKSVSQQAPPSRKPQSSRHQPARHDPAAEARRAAAERARAEANAKMQAQTQERERQEREKAERKARRIEIKQLVEQNRLKKPESDDRYNFLDGNRIRRISVDASLRAGLGEGKLLIVRNEGRYEIVPAEIAERIRVLDERSVMGTVTAEQVAADENDPYKDYVVPDDLMW